MCTEYCLGKYHNDINTPQGLGISLMAYEMSGNFDVYVDLPKERVDIDAWRDDMARVNIWDNIDPDQLLKIGLNIIGVAKKNHGTIVQDDIKTLLKEFLG